MKMTMKQLERQAKKAEQGQNKAKLDVKKVGAAFPRLVLLCDMTIHVASHDAATRERQSGRGTDIRRDSDSKEARISQLPPYGLPS